MDGSKLGMPAKEKDKEKPARKPEEQAIFVATQMEAGLSATTLRQIHALTCIKDAKGIVVDLNARTFFGVQQHQRKAARAVTCSKN